MDSNKMTLELMHYVVLSAVLLGGWVWLMGVFAGNLTYIIGSWVVLFVIADQLLHKWILDEDFMWE